jgi:hypothetical protein
VRICAAPDEDEQRKRRTHEDALLDPHQQRGGEGKHERPAIHPLQPEQAHRFRHIDQPGNGDHDDGRQHRVRQEVEERRERQQRQRHEQCRDDGRETGARTRLVVHRGTGESTRHREAGEGRARQVRQAEAPQFAVRVHPVLLPGRDGFRYGNGLHEADE